jgi:hypothetical protein
MERADHVGVPSLCPLPWGERIKGEGATATWLPRSKKGGLTSMKLMTSFLGLSVLATIILTGCVTQKGPFLMANIEYVAPEGLVAAKPKVVVGVSPFRDDRGKPVSVLGTKNGASSSGENDLVVQGTAAELVTAKFKDALKARGFAVKDVSAWDMTAEGIKAEGTDILISGEIRSLWVESLSGVLDSFLKADAQLKIFVGDAAEKKMLRTLTVNSKLERHNVAFSFDYVQETLSDSLSAAINQVFDDEEIKKKLK